MIRRLNPSVTKKLILLAFLTAGTFFVTSRANQQEIAQSGQPVVNTNYQADSSAAPSVAESLSDFRSSYKFAEEQPIRKKH